MNFIDYLKSSKMDILELTVEHIKLTAIAVAVAIIIGVPLGILISYVKRFNKPVLAVANVIQAIPSMALLGFAIPFLGIGTLPAVVMVILYSLLPIIKNTYIGLESIQPQTLEAAKGIGLTKFQRLFKVQLPLALPVIMGGVRISAVSAVGLMTMAAFIGAGGLGFLVFSGIRTVNNNQILAGAIPACILALFMDYFFGTIEKLVTPISLQKMKGNKERLLKIRKKQKIFVSFTAFILIFMFVYTTILNGSSAGKILTIASKDYTEQQILVHMVSDLIEDATDITVERKINLGGTQVIFSSITSGDIDMYIEYTGTAYGDTLKYPPKSDVQEVYDTVKKDLKEKYDLEVLEQMGFSNTYVLAVTQETANRYNLKSITDLAKVGYNLTAGTTFEFLNRQDGIPGLMEFYGFKFKNTIGLDSSPRYLAIVNKETDVVDAFSTDGLLQKFQLVTLKDDKNFFPPYYAVPVITREALEKYPEIEVIVEELGALLTDEIMRGLNYKVDEEQMEPQIVAREFLIEQGLIVESNK